MSNYPQLDLKKDRDFEAYAMDNFDCLYMGRLDLIRAEGRPVADPQRTKDTWHTVPGCVMQLANTAAAFPLPLSAKKNWVAAVDETCWFMRGETNINSLNSKIWDEWADEDGECGPIYGEMWRRWPDIKIFPAVGSDQTVAEQTRNTLEMMRMIERGAKATELPDGRMLVEGHVDQLLNALKEINDRSRSRRIRVQAFNPGYVNMQGLPPCHTGFEFNVLPSTMYEQTIMRYAHGEAFAESLHMSVFLRSSDTLLGFPFNVAGYTALFHLFAKYCGLNIGSITFDSTNTHVYSHHWDALNQQQEQFLTLVEKVRTTGQPMEYPILRIDPKIHSMTPEELLENITAEYFAMEGYNPLPAVKGRVTK